MATLLGGLLFAWPALLNGYPILFSDTQAFLVQAGRPFMIWDKPWVYGPFLWLLDGQTTLWLPLAVQALLLSRLLWLAGRTLGVATGATHIGLCLVLAAGSAAPWVASLMMPDLFAPVLVLCLFLLAFGERMGWGVAAIGVLACAAHLSHLLIAAAGLAVIAAMRPASLGRAALPLLGALAVLLGSNLYGFGRIAISPFGAVFALARLVADGPASAVIAAECPGAGWRMCDWVGRLPVDSNDFLWNPRGPVWSTPGGPIALAPEAGDIVRRTLAAAPTAVLRAALVNGWDQLFTVGLGDTATAANLEGSVTVSLQDYFPPAELGRFTVSRQAQGRLAAVATNLNPGDSVLLALGAGTSLILLAIWRRDRLRAGFVALILAGVLANAGVTGALSRVEPRYQARIAWLLLLPGAFAAMGRPAGFGAVGRIRDQTRRTGPG